MELRQLKERTGLGILLSAANHWAEQAAYLTTQGCGLRYNI